MGKLAIILTFEGIPLNKANETVVRCLFWQRGAVAYQYKRRKEVVHMPTVAVKGKAMLAPRPSLTTLLELCPGGTLELVKIHSS